MRRLDVEFKMSVKMSKIKLTANDHEFKFQGVGVGSVRCEMRNIWLTLAAVNLITTSSASRRGLSGEEGWQVGTT